MHFGGYENPPPALHIATRSCMMILVSWLVNETNACIYARNDKGQDLVEIADECNNQYLVNYFTQFMDQDVATWTRVFPGNLWFDCQRPEERSI